MKILKRLFSIFIILAVACAIAFYMGTRYEGPVRIGPATITAETIEGKFSEERQLVTEVYNYRAMGTFTNSLMFKEWTIPLTSKQFIIAYDGIIKAGIDLDKVKVTTDGYTVYIRLPEPMIISHEIDEGGVSVLDEKTNLFNPIKVEDITGFEADQKAVNEERAIQDGLLVRAGESAQKAVTELLMSIDGMKNYDIIFQ